MENHKEFQFGWITFVFAIPIQILITYFYLNDIGNSPLEANGFVVFNFMIVLTYLFLYGLTTSVMVDSINISFGIGLIKKSIQLSRIKTVEAVKTCGITAGELIYTKGYVIQYELFGQCRT
jgi:hypothetical protein